MSDDKTPSKKPTETGAAKIAEAQRAEVEGVINTDPTDTQLGTTAGTGDRAVLIGADDDVAEALYEDADSDTYVTLQKDVVGEFYFPDTRRPSHRVLYTRGQVVRKAELEAHNDAVRAAKVARERAARGEVDPQNPAGIDAVTLASGTYSVDETTKKADAVRKSAGRG